MELTKRETGIRLQAEIDFLTSTTPRQALGAIGLYPIGTGGYFPGVKRSVREGDYSILSTTEVKNTWISLFMVY
jgi:hypothetical protein